MSVGWHSDDEALFQGKFRDIAIISLSLGCQRKFELRTNWPEDGEKPVRKLWLGNGDLMSMEGMVQKHYQHRVPKEDAVSSPRINLTWRWTVRHRPRCPATRNHATPPPMFTRPNVPAVPPPACSSAVGAPNMKLEAPRNDESLENGIDAANGTLSGIAPNVSNAPSGPAKAPPQVMPSQSLLPPPPPPGRGEGQVANPAPKVRPAAPASLVVKRPSLAGSPDVEGWSAGSTAPSLLGLSGLVRPPPDLAKAPQQDQVVELRCKAGAPPPSQGSGDFSASFSPGTMQPPVPSATTMPMLRPMGSAMAQPKC